MVSVFLSSHSLPVTVFPGELILSCSGPSVFFFFFFSDPQDTSIQAFLDFPSCDGTALVVVHGSRPGVLTVILPAASVPQFPSAVMGDKQLLA